MSTNQSDCPIEPDENGEQRPTWRGLLTSRGASLWSIRRQLGRTKQCSTNAGKELCEDSAKVGAKYVILPLNASRKSNLIQRMLGCGEPNTIAVVTCPDLFSQLEQEQDGVCQHQKEKSSQEDYHGLDKPDTRGQAPRPLTRCTHDEWTRQRSLVGRAFSNLPHRSLEAAKCIRLDDILKDSAMDHCNGVLLLDWKRVAVTVALQWVVHLFRGSKDTLMEHRLLEFWKVSRSLDKISDSVMKMKKQDLSKSLQPNDKHSTTPVGVMQSLFECGLTFSESQDNCINAMIAAMDAAQSLLFWTMWNLAQRSDYWEQARATVSSESFSQTIQSDLDNLGDFKRASTKGELVDCSSLSFLGRALCETVRVFPPVWTLPRTWPRESKLVEIQPKTRWSKLDVAIVNAADSPEDWDPNNMRPSHIASFGLGRRHCPAGTAALYAVYFYLYQCIQKFKIFEEDVPGRAIDCACLLPTLSVVGQQFFRVQYDEPT